MITILGREPFVYASTAFSEVVTCRLPDGQVRRLLLKRSAAQDEQSFGHHGGVPYEARIYHTVLRPLGTSTPVLHHAWADEATGETVILVDYLEDARRVCKAGRARLHGAAAWIGAFHRANAPRVASLRATVRAYDAHYYRGWMKRTLARWSAEHPWLAALESAWDDLAARLLPAPTVIHGEYYPHNILVHDRKIVPVDWETAAIAAGEIDLVCLTEGWADADRERCQVEYARARWPEGAPAGFRELLAIAEVYVQLRWLGHSATAQKDADRLPRLRALCGRLGLVRDPR